ncbi:MAG: hypothetical protein GC145_17315 [Caulobacter sp.]|nr:hypothetical protein [Caulobacter sp.]
MAHTADHPHERHRRHKGGAAMFTGMAVLAALGLTILIGWAVWSGLTPLLHDTARDVEIAMPHVPTMPVPPDPQPLPMPKPTPPR